MTEPDPISQGALGWMDALYRQYWKDLCARLRRVYGAGPPDPEDLAQQAFARAIEIDGFETVENQRGYLFRIAVNLGLDASRRSSTARRFIQDELNALGDASLEKETPSNVYESKERLAQLNKAINSLSEKQREIVSRSRLKGETYAQIEVETGWSKADISRQLNAALKTLHAALDEYDA